MPNRNAKPDQSAAVRAEEKRRLAILTKNHGPGSSLGDWCECSRCSMMPIDLHLLIYS